MNFVPRGGLFAYGVAVLAGAALVFQIQPIAGRLLLPAFGGGASVWTTCLFFFQSMLLTGYAYAHFLTRFGNSGLQVATHAVLLVLSFLFLPAGVSADTIEWGVQYPAGGILLTLLAMVGFPFVILASTAPLMQRWSSITHPLRIPYRLYALSNAGALLALVTYPFLIEPNISLRAQTVVWSAGYGVFAFCTLVCCRIVWKRSATADPQPEGQPGDGGKLTARIPLPDAWLTVLLSASGVAILLAITNEITQNVAPVPFLWILPLVAYLLTYIICFSGESWYDRAIWGSLFVVSAGCLIILHFFSTSFPIVPVVLAYVLILLCTCIVCHAELYRVRPQPRLLTRWYLLIALGGALGGAFVSVIAPTIFTRYWEVLVAVYLLYLMLGLIVLRESRDGTQKQKTDAPRLQAAIKAWGLRLFVVAWVAGIFLLPAVVGLLNELRVRYDVASTRNFYGLLNVRDLVTDGVARRMLVDGTTIHGFQLLGQDERNVPTSYYGPNTGISMLMESMERTEDGLKVGIVGLGTGTLAAYGEPTDEFRFYEINPAVVDIARQHFSFLQDSGAAIEIVPGDGRKSLERELRQSGSRNYDLLVIDAFNSDAIPVHLLTLEALQLYWSHLKPDGVLALHLTNNYLDLVPVASNLGAQLGKQVVLVTTPRDTGVTSAADWVLLGERAGIFADLANDEVATELTLPGLERVWTDDYSDLLGALRHSR